LRAVGVADIPYDTHPSGDDIMKTFKGILAAVALVAALVPCFTPAPASAEVMPEPDEMAGCTANWQCNAYCYPGSGVCKMRTCYCF
jgi:hypothetical protein